MSTLLTFDDVLIVPRFSTITSRKDVSLNLNVGNELLTLPIISSNMDTVTGPEMAMAMASAGGRGCLHRFMSIEENVQALQRSRWGFDHDIRTPLVSIGVGQRELERGVALWKAGANIIVVDVAHGAQQAVVDQVNNLRGLIPQAYIVAGNFASADSVQDFLVRSRGGVDAIKVGVGPGSACTTRIKTGVGVPQLSAVMQIAKLLKNTKIQVIADGGMKTPGDIAKALGAGAHVVMLGGMLAGTNETPGEIVSVYENGLTTNHKKYRGSASHESYAAQGKTGSHRTAEGESFLVPCKGSVESVLADIEGGIRSAMTYVGANTLDEFRAQCEFVQISSATARENSAHGKS